MKTCKLAAFLFVTILASTFQTNAANKTPKAPEPIRASPSLDLAGVSFGQPIAIQECPSQLIAKDYRAYRSEYEIKAPDKPCWKHSYTSKPTTPLPNSGKVSVIPENQFPGVKDINVKLIDGIVEDITLITYGEGVQDKIYASLVQKYGSPTTREVTKAQNRMGAEFSNIVAEWKFTNLTVSFAGIIGSIDTGIVSASTPKAENAQAAERRERESAEPKL
ncbi:MAG: hypothetical protein WA956_11710 [Stenotrophomonas sp.]